MVAIPGDSLSKLCEQQPGVSVVLLQRLLQIIGSRLRFTRMRLIASRYGTEARTMRSILDQGTRFGSCTAWEPSGAEYPEEVACSWDA